jgi:hypothetical protein
MGNYGYYMVLWEYNNVYMVLWLLYGYYMAPCPSSCW